jgi:ABC-type molybdate transport system substrate-binding protein
MWACLRTIAIAAVLLSRADMTGAAEIRLLGVAAVQDAVRSLAADFSKETGHQVVLTVVSPGEAMQKIAANEIFDAVIVSEPAMDQLDKEGLVNPESRMRLAGAEATIYEGALMSDGAVPEAARAFIRFLASPDAADQWRAARLEPLS